jgi:hypothetical protein
MKRGRIKRVHVNQFVIRANQRDGERRAPLRVKTSSENVGAHEVVIDGPCRVIYRPERPLSCGARVWIETMAGVTVIADGEIDSRIF